MSKTKNNNTTNNGIAYKGIVTVTVKKGKKTLSRHTYHNAGGDPLFEFLCTCITENKIISSKAPHYIKLFSFATAPTSTDVAISASDASDHPSTALTTAIYFNSGTTGTDDKGYYAYLHFTIPASAISNMSDKTDKEVHQAGLYCANNVADSSQANYSAYFNFTKTESSVTTWDPITISTKENDYTIFIDWKLYFKNP